MDVNTNQFKLESLPSTSTAPAPTTRPTIPYAQFPRPSLHDPDARFDAPDPDHFDYDYDDHSDASAASSSTLRRGSFAAMDSTTTSQHRRRRSTLTSLQPPNARGQRPQRIRDGLTEELSWSQEDEPWSQDESKSNSDEAGGHGNNSSDDDNNLQDDEETGLTGSSRRQKRRRRNTLLDQRVAKESEITKEERKEADQNVIKDMAINGLFILLWYAPPIPTMRLDALLIRAPFQVHFLPLHLHLQQVDVLRRAPRLPIPTLHNMHAHARAVLPRLLSPIPPPAFPATRRLPHTPGLRLHARGAAETRSRCRGAQAPHDEVVLLYAVGALRSLHRP